MTESPSILLMILGFLLVLGPLVTIHEFGHYVVGRWFGVKADVFSVGFGRELFGWTDRRGTRWRFSALPLGGYVQFAGDMNPASQPGEEWLALPEAERAQTFQARPIWQKSLIVAAGPFTNFAVAVAIFAAFNLAYGKVEIPAVVGHVVAGSAAAEAGLQPGDRIMAVDGAAVTQFAEVGARVVPNPGEQVRLTVERDGDRRDINFIIPTIVERDRFGNEYRVGRLGIGSVTGSYVPVGPVEAMGLATVQTVDVVKMMVNGIGQIVTGRRPVTEMGGPIRIAQYSGQQLSLGWQAFASFVALISINLAFINLLPIPALDGGHLAFYALQAIRRRPLSVTSQEWAFRAGMAFVLGLMVLATASDIASLRLFGPNVEGSGG